ncbi:hypothetical protein [Hazenella coriacea]|uniref:Uncharacterized protein n=1 Tax=Hazenella coriacea TaxID=1179467 RepID=A0A4V2UVH8_9BACL|nr:hypothetical protein [Hazenella coriacea]TCS95887.1 hypothetical protein EDD58_102469 [Hazenella coriacea]
MKKSNLNDDWFQEWLSLMPDVMEELTEKLESLELDYSPESLLRLEEWILEKYQTVDSIKAESEKMTLDALLRYVGEVYKQELKGRWGVLLDDPQYIFYGLPLVLFEKEANISPLSEVVASVDRRRGDYIYKVFMNKKKRMQENGLL